MKYLVSLLLVVCVLVIAGYLQSLPFVSKDGCYPGSLNHTLVEEAYVVIDGSVEEGGKVINKEGVYIRGNLRGHVETEGLLFVLGTISETAVVKSILPPLFPGDPRLNFENAEDILPYFFMSRGVIPIMSAAGGIAPPDPCA